MSKPEEKLTETMYIDLDDNKAEKKTDTDMTGKLSEQSKDVPVPEGAIPGVIAERVFTTKELTTQIVSEVLKDLPQED